MSVTSADLAQWAAHRRAVVVAVSRRVPGVDPELATSRGLERLCAELIQAGGVSDPVAFWSAAALDVAAEMAREEPDPEPGPGPVATVADEVVTAPVRTVDFEVLSSAMERLSAAEQQILWDHHVGSQPVAAIAEEIGVLPYAARRRLRRAENRLASSFAETHAGATDGVECRTTRASMHDFVRNRLMPHRRQAVEDHMVGCAGCTRAFVDVRESYWMLRAAAPVLLLGAVAAARTGTAVAAGTVAAGATGAGVVGAGVGGFGGWSAGSGGWLAGLGARAGLVLRSVLTDPAALTATVAGGLIITTAVGTGTAGSAGASAQHLDIGIVSVDALSNPRGDARGAAPGPAKEDPAAIPELTALTPRGLATKDGVPPGLAKKEGVPPGLAKNDGVPPGLAKKEGAPPGQATGDGVPPGLAKKDGVPPGQAKKDGIPPGQAKKDGDPPGQAKKDKVPPGQAKKSGGSAGSGGSAAPDPAAEDTPAAPAEKDGTPPGRTQSGWHDGERNRGRDSDHRRGHDPHQTHSRDDHTGQGYSPDRDDDRDRDRA